MTFCCDKWRRDSQPMLYQLEMILEFFFAFKVTDIQQKDVLPDIKHVADEVYLILARIRTDEDAFLKMIKFEFFEFLTELIPGFPLGVRYIKHHKPPPAIPSYILVKLYLVQIIFHDQIFSSLQNPYLNIFIF